MSRKDQCICATLSNLVRIAQRAHLEHETCAGRIPIKIVSDSRENVGTLENAVRSDEATDAARREIELAANGLLVERTYLAG
jgi:hypothetical protein